MPFNINCIENSKDCSRSSKLPTAAMTRAKYGIRFNSQLRFHFICASSVFAGSAALDNLEGPVDQKDPLSYRISNLHLRALQIEKKREKSILNWIRKVLSTHRAPACECMRCDGRSIRFQVFEMLSLKLIARKSTRHRSTAKAKKLAVTEADFCIIRIIVERVATAVAKIHSFGERDAEKKMKLENNYTFTGRQCLSGKW